MPATRHPPKHKPSSPQPPSHRRRKAASMKAVRKKKPPAKKTTPSSIELKSLSTYYRSFRRSTTSWISISTTSSLWTISRRQKKIFKICCCIQGTSPPAVIIRISSTSTATMIRQQCVSPAFTKLQSIKHIKSSLCKVCKKRWIFRPYALSRRQRDWCISSTSLRIRWIT